MKEKLEKLIKSKAKEINKKEVSKALEKAEKWNDTHEENDKVPYTLYQLFKIFYQIVDDFIKGIDEISWYVVAISVAVLLYIINPVDLIFDYMPGIGYTDDLVVVVIFLPLVKNTMKGD